MRHNRNRRRVAAGAGLLEHLEARMVLDSAPFPSVSDLTNPNHTVVRFETNFGDIDIELFDNAAPKTVANFLKYVRDGDYDKTFFHRLVTVATAGVHVLQGGFARIGGGDTGGIGAKPIPVDLAVENEFNQTNAARTIAMARLSGREDSATSQFFFNLSNNSNLDTIDGGFTVFGRVANDRSWAVVEEMAEAEVRQEGSSNDVFASLPVQEDYDRSDGVTEDELLTIIDAEIIKPKDVPAFYAFKYYLPEGYAGGKISEFVPIGNPNGSPVHYQVIVRSEFSQPQPDANPDPTKPDPDFWYRDRVAATGQIGPNARGGVTMSSFRDRENDIVERNVPYAVEIWATAPIVPTMSHYDFGAATGENFSSQAATSWVVADVRRGEGIRDFLVWQNTSDAAANLTITFYFDTDATQASETITLTTEQFRRGGLEIASLGQLPEGAMSVRVTSDTPIVVALTHYDTNGDGYGSLTLGVTGDGSTRGVLPLADWGDENGERVAFLNAGTAPAAVTLTFTFDDGTPELTLTPAELVIPAGKRAEFDLSSVPGIEGKRVTVRFSSGSANVYAHTANRERGDELTTRFMSTAATRHMFGDGFMTRHRAGDDLFETVSVYNPNSADFGVDPTDANITFRFIFEDGFVLTKDFVVAGGERLDVDLHELEELLEQAARPNRRFAYSLDVVSDVPVVAQMRHFDLTLGNVQSSGGWQTIGLQRGLVLPLSELAG